MRIGAHQPCGAFSPTNGDAHTGAPAESSSVARLTESCPLTSPSLPFPSLLVLPVVAGGGGGRQFVRPRSAAPRSATTTRSNTKGTCISPKSAQSSSNHVPTVGSTAFGRSGCTPKYDLSRGGGCFFWSSSGLGGMCGVENVGRCGKTRRRGAGMSCGADGADAGGMMRRPAGVKKGEGEGWAERRAECVRKRERRRYGSWCRAVSSASQDVPWSLPSRGIKNPCLGRK